MGLFFRRDDGAGSVTEPFLGSGKDVAASAFTRALLRHGRVADVDILAGPVSLEAARQMPRGTGAPGDGLRPAAVHLVPDSEVAARLRAHTYDVLHDTGTDLTWPSYIRSRLSRRIFPVTCSQYAISYACQLYDCFVHLLTAQIYPCDAIVCSTQASRSAMEKRLGDIAERYSGAWDRPSPPLPRLEVIPWGVDTELFAPRDQAAARRELDLPLDRPVLLCLGRVRIEDKMDWTPLLLAFDRVRRTAHRPPVFVLAGAASSNYSEQLVAQAAQMGLLNDLRAFFSLPPACLPSLYAASDVFVSPTDSVSESFGLTIVEAMACGRPVVASDWNGYKELIVHGETGFKVRTDWADCLGELNQLVPFLPWGRQHLHVGQSVSVDVAQMAGFLTQLLDNRDLRQEMGRRGRARVEALYDWPIVIAQWENLWAELAAIARAIERKEQDRLDYLQPNYFEHFSHYASRIIDDTVTVQLTPRGKAALAGKMPLFLHPGAHGFLRPDRLRGCLSTLKPSAWLRTCLAVGDVLRALEKGQGLSRDRALMHLMWLAKYDLVSLGADESSPGEPSDE